MVIGAIPVAERIPDTLRFYAVVARIAEQAGGYRTLAACDGRMDWPRRGVYFFYEDGEDRTASGHGLRVVRIGTHALKPASRTTLWGRLLQHRGSSRSGTGNHRTSIFRLLVGAALARRGDAALPRTWGIGSDAGAPARRLGVDRETVRHEEAELERRVSEYIGQMPFLWLGVDDAPSPSSLRGTIERNVIALLSSAVEPALDPPSSGWLGAFSDREMVRASGLWNSRHVSESHDPAFLDTMYRLIAR